MQRVLMNVICGLLLSVLSCFAADAAQAADSEQGFASMFNGKDLTGWEGKEAGGMSRTGRLRRRARRRSRVPSAIISCAWGQAGGL